jgi:hypothetical protein
MDWIERFFHASPDAGDGSLELSIMIGALIGIAMILVGVTKLIPTVRSCFRSAHADRPNQTSK